MRSRHSCQSSLSLSKVRKPANLVRARRAPEIHPFSTASGLHPKLTRILADFNRAGVSQTLDGELPRFIRADVVPALRIAQNGWRSESEMRVPCAKSWGRRHDWLTNAMRNSSRHQSVSRNADSHFSSRHCWRILPQNPVERRSTDMAFDA